MEINLKKKTHANGKALIWPKFMASSARWKVNGAVSDNTNNGG